MCIQYTSPSTICQVENMPTQPLMLSSYPRAILHIDGDAFFASCEQALNPAWKGKPVITGKERGIAASISYEAKAAGVTRAMPYHTIKKLCPDVIFVPSDYESYSLFSQRFFDIVRRYTHTVEEYSIDECFADLTGMRRPLRMSFPKILKTLQDTLYKELGMTFSLGLAPTKVLSKVASKWKKPFGITQIPGRKIHEFLKDTHPKDIWGIGPRTHEYLRIMGIRDALTLAKKDEDWVMRYLTKPHQEIWHELNGRLIYSVTDAPPKPRQSIRKKKTFSPSSSDKELVFAHLCRNIENACIKARRMNLVCPKVTFALHKKNFSRRGASVTLAHASNNPVDVIAAARAAYDKLFKKDTFYRSTSVALHKLKDEKTVQLDLFSDTNRTHKLDRIFDAVDDLDKKYGKHTVFMGAAQKVQKGPDGTHERHESGLRKKTLFKGETLRQRIGIPLLARPLK